MLRHGRVLDPASGLDAPIRVIDPATFENAAQYSEGFRFVLVEGTFVRAR
jgi:hypothetical protein